MSRVELGGLVSVETHLFDLAKYGSFVLLSFQVVVDDQMQLTVFDVKLVPEDDNSGLVNSRRERDWSGHLR